MIDLRTVNTYKNNGDMLGLANYLSRYHFRDRFNQERVNATIKTLRTNGRIEQGILERADDDNQKQAIKFLSVWDNGGSTLPGLDNKADVNTYSKGMSNAIRNLVSRDAVTLSYKFGGKTNKRTFLGIDWLAKDKEYENDAFNQFLIDNNFTEKYLANNGVKFSKDASGNKIMNIDKTSPLFLQVYKAMSNLKDDETGDYRYKVAGIDGKGNLIRKTDRNASVEAIGNKYKPHGDIRITSPIFDESDRGDEYYYTPGKGVSTIYGNYDAPLSFVDEANRQKDILFGFKDKYGKEKEFTRGGVVIHNLGARDAELQARYERGEISEGFYNTQRKIIRNIYDSALTNSALTQYDMFVSNGEDGDQTLYKINETKSKANYQDLIRSYVGTDKISYAAYNDGNLFGTLITLSSKAPNTPTKEPNGKDTPSIQIFVPGLFKDQAEESFNRDSKTRAAREVNNMETYQYGVNIPNIGKVSSVRNSNGDSIFTLTHDDGKVETIDKSDAINYMNYLLIQEDGIDQANQLFYNEDGNIRKEILDSKGNINSKFQVQLKQMVDNYSLAAMSEIFPKSFASYEKFKSLVDENEGDINKAIESIKDDFITLDDIDFLNNQRFRLASKILDSIGYTANNYNIM